MGTPCSSVYTPVYVGVADFPPAYAAVTGSYDPGNAYWVFNALENLVDRNYRERGAFIGGGTREGTEPVIAQVAGRWRRLEDEAFAMQPAVEATAAELLRKDEALAKAFLAAYTRMLAQRSFDDARSLADELRTRFER